MRIRHKGSRQVGQVVRDAGDAVWVDVNGHIHLWDKSRTEEVEVKRELPKIEPWVYGVLAAFFLGLMLGAAL